MNRREARRQRLLERLADHLLERGLGEASLRPMAAAAGTSDRMLLYYFADKNELLSMTLTRIAERMLQLLESARTDALPMHQLLPQLARLLREPRIEPYLMLGLELAARAGRREEPFRRIAGQICDGFLAWIAASLAVDKESERAPLAAVVFAMIEGLVLLDGMGAESTTKAALAGMERIAPNSHRRSV